MNQLTKINRILIFILLVVVFLHFGAPFLIPFIFGVFFAYLMVPLCNFLERINIHRAIAALISTLVIFIVVGGTLYLLTFQVNTFVSDMPSIRDRLESFLESSQNTIESVTNLTMGEQNQIIADESGQIVEKIGSYVTNFLKDMMGVIFSFFVVLIYVFLLLLYRTKIFNFVMMYIPSDKEHSAEEVITKISKVAFHYLWGRAKVMILLGIMFYITFISFGLPYALLFALFGAVITIIPYLGPLLSGLLPILFSLIFFDDMTTILFFAGLVLAIQLVESYVLEPLILGQEVKLNPMVVIIAIVMGGIMWGLAGMILFIPIFAIIKIISVHHPDLKPIGFIMGHGEKVEGLELK